jgi:hypothetical protein
MQQVGGYDELREYFGQEAKHEGDTSYQPVIAVFAVALLMALASWAVYGSLLTVRAAEWFIPIALCHLGVQKLSDSEGFTRTSRRRDRGRRSAPRGGPTGRRRCGALYVDRRELKCACVGAGSSVPLGFVSLTEHPMMVAMALWMGGRALL